MTPLSDLFAQVRSFWQEASTSVRAAIAGGGALLLLLGVGLTFWAASPDFVRIYTGAPVEAQSLAKELDKVAIPYRISEDGGVLSVRRVDAGHARQVASGVTHVSEANLGLRGLDSMSPFTTYEQQRVRIERAREEAIEQELSQYAGVQKASVNLALPPENARVGEETPPKAAVTLTPLGDGSFNEAQVAAMAYVVAGSIPNLTPENVTIASSTGATLWSGADSVTGTGATGALRTRTRAEKEYARSREADLQASLDRVFGPGKAVVYVDAALDLDKQESEAKRMMPMADSGKGVPVSEATATEQYAGAAGAPVGGAAGADANRPGIPSYPAANGNSRGAGTYKNTTETINYDNSTESVRITKAAGEPKRLNVSIWVDDKLPASVQNAIQTWTQGSVINPVNAATTRVTVVPAPFNHAAETAGRAALDAAERQARLSAYAPYIVLPACLALLLLGAWLLTRRRGRLVLPGAEQERALAVTGGMALPGTHAREPDARAGAESADTLDSGENESALSHAKIRPIQEKSEPELEAILDFINTRPETAALLLRSWTVAEKPSSG